MRANAAIHKTEDIKGIRQTEREVKSLHPFLSELDEQKKRKFHLHVTNGAWTRKGKMGKDFRRFR